jgi:hypothetical protein
MGDRAGLDEDLLEARALEESLHALASRLLEGAGELSRLAAFRFFGSRCSSACATLTFAYSWSIVNAAIDACTCGSSMTWVVALFQASCRASAG